MNYPVLLALLAAGQLFAEDPRVTALVQQGDAADARHDALAALTVLRQAETLEPKNFGVLLRISKQYCDLVDPAAKDRDQSKTYADQALDYGQRAVALDAKSAKAHLNLAICLSKQTDFAANKAKVEYARQIHDEALRAVALDPADDYGWHVLGRWNSSVANLNGVLKTLASFMYGGLPAASNEEAAKCLRKATELAPQRLMHHAELAKVYTDLNQKDRAAQEWQNVLGIRPQGKVDEQYQKDARLALDTFRNANANDAKGVARR